VGREQQRIQDNSGLVGRVKSAAGTADGLLSCLLRLLVRREQQRIQGNNGLVGRVKSAAGTGDGLLSHNLVDTHVATLQPTPRAPRSIRCCHESVVVLCPIIKKRRFSQT
jgi:hypothetical protein